LAVTALESISWHVVECQEIEMKLVARTTATDVAEGVRFSLQERDVDGNDLLADFALPWTPPFPPDGTEIHVFVELRITSTDSQLASDYIERWQVSWCLPPDTTAVRRSSGVTAPLVAGSTDAEVAHEFILVDEDGGEGAGATPDDFAVCGIRGARAATGELLTPFELVARGLPISHAGFERTLHRRDPETSADPVGSLGVAFSTDGEDLCGEAVIGTPVTFYVIAKPAGAAACGVTGAEFRVETIPSGWFVSSMAPPGTVFIGDPFDGTGCSGAYSTCQRGSSVIFLTVLAVPTSIVKNHPLRIEQRNPPLNLNFPCPLVTLCDAPLYTIACMTRGATAYFNPAAETPCIPTAVERLTWGSVKQLYE
jgi:hypothetical protein